MRVMRQVRDIGAERVLALAASVADEFFAAGWKLAEYRWIAFDAEGESVLELELDAADPNAVAPPERERSEVELENPGRDWFYLNLLVIATFAIVVILLTIVALVARH